MGRKKAKKAADRQETTVEDGNGSQAKTVETRKSKPKVPGSFAPFAFLVSCLICITLIYSFFYRPVSSQVIEADLSSSLRVNLDITSLEFATEGSASGKLDICKGTNNFPGISSAQVKILNLQNKEIASLPTNDAYSKVGSSCKYKMELSEVPPFSGSKLRVFVRFPFGDSSTFTVEVGDKAPYRAVNIRLTLG